MSIEERVMRVITEQLGLDREQVLPDSDITSDLGADSLDAVELLMGFEEEFHLEIPDDLMTSLTTPTAITSYLVSRGIK